jgi:septum site-determining protein MinD
MAQKIFMTAFKGGVGVTSCAFGLGAALSVSGHKTLILDGDDRCACAFDVAGISGRKVYTLGDAEKGACRFKQCAVNHPKLTNLYFISCLGRENKRTDDSAVASLDGLFDYIICDGVAMNSCDRALVVTDPYFPSVKSAESCIAFLRDNKFGKVEIIVNKVNGGLVFDGEIMTPQEIARLLRADLLAVIPEDLSLPCGRVKPYTQKAFDLCALALCGKSDKTLSVIKPYLGINGLIKRKMRQQL